MGEVGKVIKTEGRFLTVSIERKEACAHCRACIAGMNTEEMLMRAENECNAKDGDFVEVELRQGYFTKAVLIMYGIPLVMMLFGFAIGYFGAPYVGLTDYADILSFVLGILLLILTYLGIARGEKRRSQSGKFTPYAVRVVEQPQSGL